MENERREEREATGHSATVLSRDLASGAWRDERKIGAMLDVAFRDSLAKPTAGEGIDAEEHTAVTRSTVHAETEAVLIAVIAHNAGHKHMSTTTQFVHSNRAQTRAVLKARPGIPVTDSKSADLNGPASVLTIRNHNASEDGGIGRRAGFRFQCP